MHSQPNDASGTVDAIARFRFTLMGQASNLLEKGNHADGNGDPLREVTGMLVTSLEELKVAEEELRAQNDRLLEERALIESEARRYKELFARSPAAAIITDLHGTIYEVNVTASHMLRRDSGLLMGKPLAALVGVESRDDFRRKLSRVQANGGPRDWRFTVNRGNDVPLDVCATVQRIVGSADGDPQRLYWLFSAPPESGTHVWDFDGRVSE